MCQLQRILASGIELPNVCVCGSCGYKEQALSPVTRREPDATTHSPGLFEGLERQGTSVSSWGSIARGGCTGTFKLLKLTLKGFGEVGCHSRLGCPMCPACLRLWDRHPAPPKATWDPGLQEEPSGVWTPPERTREGEGERRAGASSPGGDQARATVLGRRGEGCFPR